MVAGVCRQHREPRTVPCECDSWRQRPQAAGGCCGKLSTCGGAMHFELILSARCGGAQSGESAPAWCVTWRESMSISLEALEAEVLRLEPAERAKLLERLIESFEPDDQIQNMWLAEAGRREDDVLAGRTSMVPGHEAMARIRARIA